MATAYILDLDGVIYHGKTIIPGADVTIENLRNRGNRVIFLTNNATRTRGAIAQRLMNMGITCTPEDVISSAFAASIYIKEQYGPCTIYPIGEQGLVEELVQSGHRIAEGNIDMVVVGLDREFTYRKLALGLDNLRKGAGFIATNTDAMLPTESGFLPGAGSMVAALKTASGVEPFVIGKPNRPIIDILLNKYDLKSKDCIMVGDRLDTDILTGIRAGMKTTMVLTGVSTIEDIQTTGITPDTVLGSIADLM